MALFKNNLILLLLVLSPLGLLGQKKGAIPKCEQAKAICTLMNDIHYNPLKLNNTLSVRTYKNFFDYLDPYKAYLLPEDYKIFIPYKKQLDDLIWKNSCEFTEKVAKIYEQRLQEVETLCNKILDEGFEYDKEEFITIYHNPVEQPMVEDREDYWRKTLKHHVVYALYSDHRDSTGKLNMEKVMEHEAETREKIRERRACSIAQKRGPNGDLDKRIHEFYLNAIAASFDPHSMYFTREDNDLFNTEMSTESLSFGIDFRESKNDELVVATISPGGAAWKANIFAKGDVVKEIRFDNKAPIRLTCIDSYDLMLQLNSSAISEMEILIKKKKSGTLYRHKLTKMVEKVSFNRTKSFLLEGENKVAYLSVPSFYTAEDRDAPEGVAKDIATEIEQLQQEGMEGLIIDLRNNTGGSLDETVDIASGFIDKGLLIVQQYASGLPELIKDENEGTLYDGPIVLMVNGNSSSAAEILPAALQCYNRGVVVGSTTHGKSSSQIVLPLDLRVLEEPYADYSDSPNGFLKLTISKLYSVDGKTHQADGLVPDIKLPDHYNLYYQREKDLNYPLNKDSFKLEFTSPYPSIDLGALAQKSAARVSKNSKFKFLDFYIDSIGASNVKQSKIPLKLTDFWKVTDGYGKLFKRFDKEFYLNTKVFSIKNHARDLKLIKDDEVEKELNTEWLKDIRTDVYIEESYFIMQDLIDGL